MGVGPSKEFREELQTPVLFGYMYAKYKSVQIALDLGMPYLTISYENIQPIVRTLLMTN